MLAIQYEDPGHILRTHILEAENDGTSTFGLVDTGRTPEAYCTAASPAQQAQPVRGPVSKIKVDGSESVLCLHMHEHMYKYMHLLTLLYRHTHDICTGIHI